MDFAPRSKTPATDLPPVPRPVAKPAPKPATKPVVKPAKPALKPATKPKPAPKPISSAMPKFGTARAKKSAVSSPASPNAVAVFRVPSAARQTSSPRERKDSVELGVITDYKNKTVADALQSLPAEQPAKSEKPAPKSAKPAEKRTPKLGDRSPFFLNSISVEKRPLSNRASTARKNIYPKKPTKTPDTPVRPTVVVPASQQSKAPIIFFILLTVILGAVVGAVTYFCFFQ